jgi:hypothetical protein
MSGLSSRPEWHDLVIERVPDRFSSAEDSHEALAEAVMKQFGSESTFVVGKSEEGRPIQGFVVGRGPVSVSLIAGNHADEPVGPETLRALLGAVADHPREFEPLLSACTLRIIPHCNPDGEARNRLWARSWPDIESFLEHAVREEPGRDLEFGYPDLRIENRAVVEFLHPGAPIDLHMSLHGMAFAHGALLLINRRHAPHTDIVRSMFGEAVARAGLSLHDENRRGEKGFFYLGPGFWTTPEGAAMRDHFAIRGQPEMAARFRDSSMEHVESLGGRPLSLVTEIPLFELDASASDDLLPSLRAYRRGAVDREIVRDALSELTASTRAVPIQTAVGLQLAALIGGLAYVQDGKRFRDRDAMKS